MKVIFKQNNFLGIFDRVHIGLHPEAGVQVRVWGEGDHEGLRHVHLVQIPEKKLDRPGAGKNISRYFL